MNFSVLRITQKPTCPMFKDQENVSSDERKDQQNFILMFSETNFQNIIGSSGRLCTYKLSILKHDKEVLSEEAVIFYLSSPASPPTCS
jgi:hypothetical protein